MTLIFSVGVVLPESLVFKAQEALHSAPSSDSYKVEHRTCDHFK